METRASNMACRSRIGIILFVILVFQGCSPGNLDFQVEGQRTTRIAVDF